MSDVNITVTHSDIGLTVTRQDVEFPITLNVVGTVDSGGGSGVSDGNKGDITVSGSGAVWNINAGVVDSAELASNSVTGVKIAAGNVSTDKLTDGAVTEAKLADGSVTVTKIGTGAVNESKIATGAVTETKLGARSVTAAKLFEVGHEKLIGRHGAGAGDAQEVGIDGGLEFFGGNIRRAALTGDVTASAGSNTTTLANSGVAAGSYGSASAIPVLTVDAKGRVTNATTASISSGAVKKVWTQTISASGSSTAFIPQDGTIPQVTEGAELFSIPVSPNSASSKLVIQYSVWVSPSSAAAVGVAVFVDGAADAVASTIGDSTSVANYSLHAAGTFVIDSWTGEKPVALRFGMGSSMLWYWLRSSTTVIFGSSVQGCVVITEVET